MNASSRCWIGVASVLGGLAVALGALGAHGVPSFLESQGFDDDAVAKRLDDFDAAARYQMYGALFLLGIGIVIDRLPGRAFRIAAWTMLAGVLVFSSVLYAVALVPDEMRGTFGRFAPIGGSLMIAAWVAVAIGALKK